MLSRSLSRSASVKCLPTAWIAEGLLIYLPEDAVELLLARISAKSAAGSRMGLTLQTAAAMVAFAANSLLCRIALVGGWIDAPTFATVRIGSGALLLAWLVRGTKRVGGMEFTISGYERIPLNADSAKLLQFDKTPNTKYVWRDVKRP